MRAMRVWIGAGFGVGLLLLGAAIPFGVPLRDQTEVMVITVFFSLTGAMLVYAALSGRAGQPAPEPSRRARPWLAAGGGALILFGLGLPLVYAIGKDADARFLWMVAYAPLALAGAAAVWRAIPATWRARLSADEAPGPAARRSSAPRLAAGSRARIGIRVALIVLIALLGAAIAVTVLATVLGAGLTL